MGRVAAAPTRLSRLLKQRPRRLRSSAAMRALVRETRLVPQQLVMPMFVIEGHDREEPIPSLPGHSRLSSDRAVAMARDLAKLGVGGLLLFGIPEAKDDDGHSAADPHGPVAKTLRALREAGLPLVLAADVCLCEYTSHGHCGVIVDGAGRQRRDPASAGRGRGHVRRGGSRPRRSQRHDGRPGGGASGGSRRGRAPGHRDHGLRVEGGVGVLRPVPRGRGFHARLRRSARLPDGLRQRPRGAARDGAGRRRGSGHPDGQAGAHLSRPAGPGARTLRPAPCRLPRQRRGGDARSRRGAGLDRSPRRGARDAHGDRPRRRGHRDHLSRRRRRAMAAGDERQVRPGAGPRAGPRLAPPRRSRRGATRAPSSWPRSRVGRRSRPSPTRWSASSRAST